MGALQIRSKNLLNLRVRECVRETLRALPPRVAERRIDVVRNFVGMPHKINRARLLRFRSHRKDNGRKEPNRYEPPKYSHK